MTRRPFPWEVPFRYGDGPSPKLEAWDPFREARLAGLRWGKDAVGVLKAGDGRAFMATFFRGRLAWLVMRTALDLDGMRREMEEMSAIREMREQIARLRERNEVLERENRTIRADRDEAMRRLEGSGPAYAEMARAAQRIPRDAAADPATARRMAETLEGRLRLAEIQAERLSDLSRRTGDPRHVATIEPDDLLHLLRVRAGILAAEAFAASRRVRLAASPLGWEATTSWYYGHPVTMTVDDAPSFLEAIVRLMNKLGSRPMPGSVHFPCPDCDGAGGSMKLRAATEMGGGWIEKWAPCLTCGGDGNAPLSGFTGPTGPTGPTGDGIEATGASPSLPRLGRGSSAALARRCRTCGSFPGQLCRVLDPDKPGTVETTVFHSVRYEEET